MIRELKKNIKKLVDPISELAFDFIPDTKIYPHIVANIGMDMVNEGRHNMIIDFDIWDSGKSTKNIDELSEQLIEILDRRKIITSKLSVAIYHVSSNYIEDSNKNIRRKTCTFEMQVRKGK